jgi:hypothetical protein
MSSRRGSAPRTPAPHPTYPPRTSAHLTPNKLITFLGETTLEGDRRSCSVGDMGKLEELIVSVDDENRCVVHSIRESQFNFTHHSASMQAITNGEGRTRFLWVTDLKPDDAVQEDIFDAAVASVKEALRS